MQHNERTRKSFSTPEVQPFSFSSWRQPLNIFPEIFCAYASLYVNILTVLVI